MSSSEPTQAPAAAVELARASAVAAKPSSAEPKAVHLKSNRPIQVPGGAKVLTARPILPSRKKLFLVLTLAFSLRLALFIFTDLASFLVDRPELSTPINSFKSLLEAHFLHRNRPIPPPGKTSNSAYHSGTIYHSPLLLPLLHVPLSQHLADHSELLTPLLWSLADVLGGYLLFRITLTRETSILVRKTHIFAWDASRAIKVACIYLFNPYTLGVCLARSTSSFEAVALLAAIHAAMNASTLVMSISWAGASLLGLYPVIVVPVLIRLCVKRAGEAEYEREATRLATAASQNGHLGAADAKAIRRAGFLSDRIVRAKRWAFFKSLLLCPLALAGGVFLSRAIASSPGHGTPLAEAIVHARDLAHTEGWEWAWRVYGTIILATDLTPNLGLWWYFFIEIFDHFRDFFLLTFNVHVVCYVFPVLFKYRQDPLFGLTVLAGIAAVFKSYPTVGDHALFLSLFSLHSQIFEYLRYPLVSALTYAYCTLLAPAFHQVWLEAGSGNANFFYAITLVWALGGGMLVLDAMWAWGRERWEAERTRLRAKEGETRQRIRAVVQI